jgi:integrase
MSKSTEPRPRRANGEGYLKHDPKRDRWRGAVAWLDPDGTLKRKAFSGPTRAAVRDRMDDLRSELAAGRRPVAPQSVADYLTGWLEAERARVRPSTWRYRESHARLYLVPAIGGAKLADLQPRDVERMTTAMVERGLAPRTAAGCRTTLRKALGDAVRDGLVHRNVAALARPPRVPGRDVEYLTRDELRSLLDACSDRTVTRADAPPAERDDGPDAPPDPMGSLVTLAATTGLRQGELLGLAWADVDLEAATLTVRRAMARSWDGYALAEPKTARSRRTVHLPDRAVEALKERQADQEAEREAAGPAWWQDADDLIFTDPLGRPWRSWTVTHAFHAMLERAGIRSVPFHALRHSWATLALSAGVPLKVVADNLGHASITVTAAFYSGIVPELNRDAAAAVGKALS